MTQIRPQLFPQTPQAQGSAADAAKLAQVRALFSQAMGQAPPAAAVAAQPSAIAPAPVQMAAPQDASQRIPRPGSILDIRV